MSSPDALRHAGLDAQSAALTDGSTSALRLADAYLHAIDASRSRINAYISVDATAVRAAAQASDVRRAAGRAGPLEGLCIAVKDNIDVEGLVTTAGMATRRDAPAATADAPVVARLRAAGAIVLGKLNMHEAALGADNDNPHFGACHHPLRHGHTPGGSSGGAGAAVAAGLCSAALGSDSMGSIRIPASYCGVYGLKPGAGVISPRGSVVVSRRLDCIGPLARSASDLQRLLEVMAGFDPGCAQSRPVQFVMPSNKSLRLGLPAFPAGGPDPEVLAAFEQGCGHLRRLGHQLVQLPAPDPAPGSARRAGLLLCEAEMLVEHAADWQARRELFSPALQRMLHWAEQRSAADLVAADRLLDAVVLQMQRWLSACDLLLWPTTPQTAFAFADGAPSNQADYTCFANMAGLPAVSIPAPVPAGALPVGLQLIGDQGDEQRLLVLARSLAAGEGT